MSDNNPHMKYTEKIYREHFFMDKDRGRNIKHSE